MRASCVVRHVRINSLVMHAPRTRKSCAPRPPPASLWVMRRRKWHLYWELAGVVQSGTWSLLKRSYALRCVGFRDVDARRIIWDKSCLAVATNTHDSHMSAPTDSHSTGAVPTPLAPVAVDMLIRHWPPRTLRLLAPCASDCRRLSASSCACVRWYDCVIDGASGYRYSGSAG